MLGKINISQSLALISIVLAFFVTYFLSDRFIIYAFIVFGQAHTLISYVYTYKSGKLNHTYLVKMFVFLIAIVGLYFLASFPSHGSKFPILFILLVLFLFTLHYVYDEIKIGTTTLFTSKILGSLAVSCVFLSFFLTTLYPHPFRIAVSIFVLLAIVFACVFVYKNRETFQKEYVFWLFFFGNFFIPLYLLIYGGASRDQVVGFIVFFHYIRWYLHYLYVLKDEVRTTYIQNIILCNGICLALFFLFYFYRPFSFLYIFFSPLFFYGWTMLHIFLSARKNDFTLR